MTSKQETKEKVLRVRLTSHQLKKLEAYAERHGVSKSYVIQRYIDRLPNEKELEHSSL